MSLNVSYSQNINKGIDTKVLKEVTQEIFKRAESKTVDLSTLDLSKFKRADLGMDLYSGKVDSSVARQVAMNNSGMQVAFNENTITSLRFLNSEASKSIFKVVEGKISPAVNEETTMIKKVVELPKFSQLIKTVATGKDKNGSNPFYKGEFLKIKKKEEAEVINIFA